MSASRIFLCLALLFVYTLAYAATVPDPGLDRVAKQLEKISRELENTSRITRKVSCEVTEAITSAQTRDLLWYFEHLSVPFSAVIALGAFLFQLFSHRRQRKQEHDELDRTRYRDATQQYLSYLQHCLGRPVEDRLFNMRDFYGLETRGLRSEEKIAINDARILRDMLICHFEEILILYKHPVTEFQLAGRRLWAKYLGLCLGEATFFQSWQDTRGSYAAEFYEYGDMLRCLYELVYCELHADDERTASRCEEQLLALYCSQIKLKPRYPAFRMMLAVHVCLSRKLNWNQKWWGIRLVIESRRRQDAFFEALKYYHRRALDLKPLHELTEELQREEGENLIVRIRQIFRDDQNVEEVRSALRDWLVREFVARLRGERKRARWYEYRRLPGSDEELRILGNELANVWYQIANRYVALQVSAVLPTGCAHTIQGDPEPFRR